MPIVRDRALLLRRYPYGESSLVVHLCTRQHGRVHLIAKGAYRPTSRYFAVLDYFDTLEVEWDHHPQRELSNLRSGSIEARRRAISEDVDAFGTAMSMIELTDLASRPEQREEPLFDLLEESLDRLGSAASSGVARGFQLIRLAFELHFLRHVGLGIALERCASCGGPAPALGEDRLRAAFSAGAGGRLCPGCARARRADGLRVGTMPVEVLEDAGRILSARDWSPVAGSRERLERARDLVERFLDHHLETRVRTHRGFLAHPNRNARRASSSAR
jgi:DNA repair protein RecO (recombination protein O)